MTPIDFEALLRDILDQATTLAEKLFAEFRHQAVDDVRAFLLDSRADFERWTGELAQGEIDRDEFHDLVQGQIDVAELHALKQAGLAEVMVDTFVDGVVNIATAVVFGALFFLF